MQSVRGLFRLGATVLTDRRVDTVAPVLVRPTVLHLSCEAPYHSGGTGRLVRDVPNSQSTLSFRSP
jgi:hypothetical protein